MTWRSQALCAQIDPDAHFPESGVSHGSAKATCGKCPVIQECLEFAIDNHIREGIWGGKNVREHEAIARERRRAA